jgi:hypothetical protein
LMRSRFFPLALSVILLAQMAMSQALNPAQEALAIAVHETNGLLSTLEKLTEFSSSALQHARLAQSAAKASEQTELESTAIELEKQVAALHEAIATVRSRLDQAHAAAQKVAPSKVITALRKAQSEFEAAEREPDLDTSQSSFKSIAKNLGNKLFANNREAEQLCTYAYFKAAELRRRSAGLDLKSGNSSSQAEQKLLQTRKEYLAILNLPDATNTSEGSSIHAIARRWIINIDASFYERYYRIATDPSNARQSGRYGDKAKAHFEHAYEVLEAMERVNAEATYPNGRLVVEEVRLEVNRLFQRPK